MSTAFAYIADVTPPEKRAARFGLVSSAFGPGFILGPALGGLLGAVDPRAPFWAAAALSLANALYGLLVLPESLPKERRAAFNWRRANPAGSLVLLRSHPQLLGLAAVNFLGNLAHVVLPSTHPDVRLCHRPRTRLAASRRAVSARRHDAGGGHDTGLAGDAHAGGGAQLRAAGGRNSRSFFCG